MLSDQLKAWDREHVWHPFTQMRDWQGDDPIVITRGQGVWLQDSDGRRYLDGVASLWTNVHGHCRPEINAAIKEQVDRLEHSTLLGLANDQSILLARRLAELAPEGLSHVFYSDNGSTAVEVGLKMAFQFWQHQGQQQRSRFISFSHSYHGDTLGCVSVGGIDLFHGVFRPLLFPTLQAPAPYCYRCPYGNGDPRSCNRHCLAALEQLMADHAHETAGLVLEPLIQCAGGMIVQPPGFLQEVRRLCNRYDILMIADEVAVGFGRTGAMFACEREGVTPDIMAIAKGLTGGYLPLAATLASHRVYEAFLGEYRELKTFFHGHTFTGNPLACAAALASIRLFDQDRLLEQLPAKIRHLETHLARLADMPHVGHVRSCGLMAGIELVAHRQTRTPYAWEDAMGVKVCRAARAHGLFLRPLGNVLVVFPPLSISEAELDLLFHGLAESIADVTGT